MTINRSESTKDPPDEGEGGQNHEMLEDNSSEDSDTGFDFMDGEDGELAKKPSNPVSTPETSDPAFAKDAPSPVLQKESSGAAVLEESLDTSPPTQSEASLVKDALPKDEEDSATQRDIAIATATAATAAAVNPEQLILKEDSGATPSPDPKQESPRGVGKERSGANDYGVGKERERKNEGKGREGERRAWLPRILTLSLCSRRALDRGGRASQR